MQIPVNALESSDEEGKILAFARRTLSNETDKTESTLVNFSINRAGAKCQVWHEF